MVRKHRKTRFPLSENLSCQNDVLRFINKLLIELFFVVSAKKKQGSTKFEEQVLFQIHRRERESERVRAEEEAFTMRKNVKTGVIF